MFLAIIVSLSSSTLLVKAEKVEKNSYIKEEQLVELFLQSIGHPGDASNPIELKNLTGDLEALSFDVNQMGYIILNINDFTVPELSLVTKSPFDKNDINYYNGPFQYYKLDDKKIISVQTNKTLDLKKIGAVYDKSNNKKKIDDELSKLKNVSLLRAVDVEKYIPGSLSQWYIGGGHCGSIASAIVMKYYDTYINGNYVLSSYQNQNALISLMQQYVGAGGTGYSNLVNGLNRYMSSRGVGNSCARTNGFNFGMVARSINMKRPAIVGTVNHSTFGDHWIIAHGYFQSAVNGNYVIVNNGWGQNNVWVRENYTNLDGVIYFAK